MPASKRESPGNVTGWGENRPVLPGGGWGRQGDGGGVEADNALAPSIPIGPRMTLHDLR